MSLWHSGGEDVTITTPVVIDPNEVVTVTIDPDDVVEVSVDHRDVIPDVEAARAGAGIWRWVNEATPGAAQTVLTNGPTGDQPGIYYNLASGQQVLIRETCFGVNTVSDNCYFELGYTTGANGTGTFVPITPRFYVATGAALQGRATIDRDMSPPPCLKYSDGVRSITYRVDANDAGCQITVAWHGWTESETWRQSSKWKGPELLPARRRNIMGFTQILADGIITRSNWFVK